MDVTTPSIRSAGEQDARGLVAGRHFVVTGGARGIGAAVVRTLAAHGARGLVLDLNAAADLPFGWSGVSADVTDERSVIEILRVHAESNGPFDGLVAAAGIVPAWHGPADLDLAEFDRTMSVNVRGFVVALKGVARTLSAGSTVVAVGSLNSWRGDPNLLGYAASKHAVLGVVRSAALALGPQGVRVNAVAPGPIATEALVERIDARVGVTGRDRGAALEASAALTALGHIATVDDVANAVLFLSCPLSASTTGHLVPVDSGLL